MLGQVRNGYNSCQKHDRLPPSRRQPTVMANTLAKHIRIDEPHWKRIESLAIERGTTPNQLLVELAIEALDHRQWPRTAHEIRLLRACLFTSQAIARDMIAAGRDEEVEDIRREISTIVPDLSDGPAHPSGVTK